MASNYSKLDLKSFKERLSQGHYKNATGARRGVGKSEMGDDEKAKAYKVIDAHFGGESKPVAAAPATKAKRTATKAAPVKAAATKARGTGRGKRTAAKKTSVRGSKSAPAEGAPANQEIADLHVGALATREAMAGLAAASELHPGLDVKEAVAQGAGILQHSINRIGELLGHEPRGTTAPPAPPSEDGAAEDPDDSDESS